MSYNEAQTWANTSFKRLWHLGYKGRYAFFSWPTYSPATSLAGGYLTYNKSEYRAWLSGVAFKSFVTSLQSDYTKNIMAHSMGNVVVGSAFRQGVGGISNYALFNAAMAAQAYDPTQIDMDRFVFENNYRSLFGSEHSAEWIWSLQRTFGVWRALLNSFDINPNPMP
jgi:hypothetical protein